MKTQSEFYDAEFFDSISSTSLKSAQAIVPIVLNLIPARSVVDVGCGRGAWLLAFQENGVEELRGVDGGYVDRSAFLVDPDCFIEMDLRKTTRIPGQFDLAVCLEVGEHLPPQAAPNLVKGLTQVAPAVLFSAAIPGQGGTCHINEQWPQYWAVLFEKRGYVQLDAIRRHTIADPNVAYWYKQNTFLYVHSKLLERSELLRHQKILAEKFPLQFVHRSVLAKYTSFRTLLRELPCSAWRALKNRISWFS